MTIGDAMGERIEDDASVCSVLFRELFVRPGVGGSSADADPDGDAVASRMGGGRRFAPAPAMIAASGAATGFKAKGAVVADDSTIYGNVEPELFVGFIVTDCRFALTVIGCALPWTETRRTTDGIAAVSTSSNEPRDELPAEEPVATDRSEFPPTEPRGIEEDEANDLS